MKYIRTKDGIYEVNSSNYTLVEGFITVNALHKSIVGIRTNSIIKHADTIEELCDVFIVIDEDKKRNIYLKEDDWTFDMIQDLGMWSDRTCYGAIWTDKGLIYVAKMNENGELELL